MGETILVIGGNGCVGREVVAQLFDSNFGVCALVRSGPKVAALKRDGITILRGEMARPGTFGHCRARHSRRLWRDQR